MDGQFVQRRFTISDGVEDPRMSDWKVWVHQLELCELLDEGRRVEESLSTALSRLDTCESLIVMFRLIFLQKYRMERDVKEVDPEDYEGYVFQHYRVSNPVISVLVYSDILREYSGKIPIHDIMLLDSATDTYSFGCEISMEEIFDDISYFKREITFMKQKLNVIKRIEKYDVMAKKLRQSEINRIRKYENFQQRRDEDEAVIMERRNFHAAGRGG